MTMPSGPAAPWPAVGATQLAVHSDDGEQWIARRTCAWRCLSCSILASNWSAESSARSQTICSLHKNEWRIGNRHVHQHLHEAGEAHHQRSILAEHLDKARQAVHAIISICVFIGKDRRRMTLRTNADALEDLTLDDIHLLVCLELVRVLGQKRDHILRHQARVSPLLSRWSSPAAQWPQTLQTSARTAGGSARRSSEACCDQSVPAPTMPIMSQLR